MRQHVARALTMTTKFDAGVGGLSVANDFQKKATGILGNGLVFAPNNQPSDLDAKEGYGRSTTGLPYTISGTAKVISNEVGEHFVTMEDPLKVLLPMTVSNEAKIIVRQQTVVGGAATIVPERASARTVGIMEDLHEYEMTRYGVDIEMNANQFLAQGHVAQKELDMKVDAQKRELSAKLIELGYNMLMRQGTYMNDAIVASMPAVPSNVRKSTAHRVYCQSIFGALNKSEYGVTTLLTAARAASAYPVGSSPDSMLIIPTGAPDVMKYAHKGSCDYSVTGAAHHEMKPVKLSTGNVWVDNRSGTKIMVRAPAIASRTSMQPGKRPINGLTRRTWIISRHDCNDNDRIPDLLHGGYVKIEQEKTVYRAVQVVASAAIMGIPGDKTGNMLFGFPFTGVSTSHAEERLRIQLRLYLGAALYKPQNVLVMPDAFVENVVEQFFFGSDIPARTLMDILSVPPTCTVDATNKGNNYTRNSTFSVLDSSDNPIGTGKVDTVTGTTVDTWTFEASTTYDWAKFNDDWDTDLGTADAKNGGDNTLKVKLKLEDVGVCSKMSSAGKLTKFDPTTGTQTSRKDLAELFWPAGKPWTPPSEETNDLSTIHIAAGAVYTADQKEKSPNSGEFGALDHPTKYTHLFGSPQPANSL